MAPFTISGANAGASRAGPCLQFARVLARRHKLRTAAALNARQPRAETIAMSASTPQRAAAHLIAGPALKRFALAALCVGFAGFGGHGSVHAQAELPTTAPAAAAADRAKRDADKVYELIRMHADRPRKAPAAVVVPVQAPAAIPEVEQPTRPTVVALTATPRLPAAAARLPESSSAGHGGLAPAVAFAAPVHATELTLKQVSLPAVAMSSGGAPVVASELTAPTLVLVSSIEPDFPRQLTRRLGQGSVVVHFEVLPDGTVGATNIDKGRHPGLNAAALAAVAAWRFKPISKAIAAVTEMRFE